MLYPTKKLEKVCDAFADGDWIETKDQSDDGIRLIQTGNVGEGVFLAKDGRARYVSEETFARLNCTEIFPDDLLISRLPDPIGRACILPELPTRMITAVDCTIVRTDPKKLLPKFLLFYTNSTDYHDQLTKYLSGTTRTRISRGNLAKIEIPVPPVGEQRRIVERLEKQFAKIDEAARLRVQNQAATAALLPAALHEIFSQAESRGWDEKTLPEISENLDSKRKPITKSARKLGPYPYYGASGIVDSVAGYIFDEDILLISEDGANLLARSTPIAFSVSGKVWVNNHAHVLKFMEPVTQRLVEYFLNSIDLRPYISGSAQPKLNQGKMNKIKIPLPSLAEQKAIVKKLDALSEKVNALQGLQGAQAADLKALKQSILHEAFR